MNQANAGWLSLAPHQESAAMELGGSEHARWINRLIAGLPA
jgi:hypothetical protein